MATDKVVSCAELKSHEANQEAKEDASFLKKRSKKLLFNLESNDCSRRAPIDKVFLLLFVHKKKTLSCILTH